MKKWIDFINKHKHRVNKYHITIVVFLVVTFFVGDNTFWDGIRYGKKIKSLQEEIKTCRKDNDSKISQLKAMQGDKDSLEEFAREQFHMAKEGEDIFLIVE